MVTKRRLEDNEDNEDESSLSGSDVVADEGGKLFFY